MQIISHITYPALAYTVLTKTHLIPYSTPVFTTLIGASILPDLDFLYQLIVKKKGFDHSFQHRNWASHWPIMYLPLVFLTLITRQLYLSVATIGIYFHFVLDTIYAGDGLMWLYPFSKKMYGFLNKETKGHHGKEWLTIYRSLPVFKLDIICFVLLITLLLLPHIITK